VKHVIAEPEKDVDIQPTAADSILIVVTGLVQVRWFGWGIQRPKLTMV
jgi:hypothetical protein